MWKIAIATMLLASASFGAVSVTMTPQPATVSPTAWSQTFTMAVQVTGTDILDGFSIYAGGNDPTDALVKWTGRTIAAANVGKMENFQADPPGLDGKMLSDFVDLGAGRKTSSQHFAAGDYPIADLTFEIPAGQEVTFKLYAGSWIGTPGGDLADVPVTIMPEPASMMLLAAGAAFFARRRRA